MTSQTNGNHDMFAQASPPSPGAGATSPLGQRAARHSARARQSSFEPHSLQRARQAMVEPKDNDMMGPVIRRKKVVSMPYSSTGNDFFFGPAGSQMQTLREDQSRSAHLIKEPSWPPGGAAKIAPKKGTLGLSALVKRKQVSLDLYAPEQAEFFATVPEEEVPVPPPTEQKAVDELAPVIEGQEAEKPPEVVERPKPFFPLQFSPPVRMVARQAGGHGGGHGGSAPVPLPVTEAQGPVVDDELRELLEKQANHQRELKTQIAMLADRLEGEADREQEKLLEDIHSTQTFVETDNVNIRTKLIPPEKKEAEMEQPLPGDADKDKDIVAAEEEDDDDAGIIRATKLDYIWTGVLLMIMIGFTAVVIWWETHLDETYSTFGAVGLACVTPCTGDLDLHDYFHGHSHFEEGQFIQLTMQLDPKPIESDAVVQIVGYETGEVKAELVIGPCLTDVPAVYVEKILVDFDHPHEDHIINVTSADPDIMLSYKMNASVMSPMAKNSVLIAALIMIFVYIFILLEVIHRTLVAIFGAFIALLFFFLIHQGETESISTIMLHMEWSTLALLFGMMLIVGELSHTGIFEWFAVRLLVASKGSYNRLMILLSLLTALASAFLDNVTTMLLVAPVTIDMCRILDVDPRPYLIGEVLLSNVGGTATLIGDPPNIIIGSAFSAEIGFVDFIINILPCIFFFCVPASIAIVLYLYRYYMSNSKMPELDHAKLIRTYRIYDEPRLMIAGMVAFFVILIFFLHPVHHKDTAWIALLGAFITIAFTNPHDVQDALRNHVEWDTLLFFAGLFVLVEVCAALGLLAAIGQALANLIEAQDEEKQLAVAITLILWVSAITSAFLDNIPYTATMIPVIRILADQLPDTLPIETLAWALSFGACLGGNGTLLGASANIVTAGIATNKGFEISFVNFLYPGMAVMFATVALANLYMLVVFVWI